MDILPRKLLLQDSNIASDLPTCFLQTYKSGQQREGMCSCTAVICRRTFFTHDPKSRLDMVSRSPGSAGTCAKAYSCLGRKPWPVVLRPRRHPSSRCSPRPPASVLGIDVAFTGRSYRNFNTTTTNSTCPVKSSFLHLLFDPFWKDHRILCLRS